MQILSNLSARAIVESASHPNDAKFANRFQREVPTTSKRIHQIAIGLFGNNPSFR